MDRSPLNIVTTLVLSLLCQLPLSADSVEKALAMRPVQVDVQYEEVPDDDVKNCTLGNIKIKGWRGYELLGPDGATLRRFADTNGDKKVNLWAYFEYGVEVYRDIDEDFDGKADQYRWLNTGGTRWGLDEDEDGQINRWKQISAEEVSAEVVAAIRDRDIERFNALLISEDEIKSLGLNKSKAQQISVKADRAARLCCHGEKPENDRSQCELGTVCCLTSRPRPNRYRWIDQGCRRLRKCRRDV